MNNKAKYLSYTKAWKQINSAVEQGFYLEAVAIEESIISDRILSYVSGIDPKSTLRTKSSFHSLISEWRKLAGNQLIDAEGRDLGAVTDAWRTSRNTVVHGLVKSSPGAPTDDVDNFIELARLTADDGKLLAREVQDWHKKALCKARNKCL